MVCPGRFEVNLFTVLLFFNAIYLYFNFCNIVLCRPDACGTHVFVLLVFCYRGLQQGPHFIVRVNLLQLLHGRLKIADVVSERRELSVVVFSMRDRHSETGLAEQNQQT